jgi:hypothetical protein
MLVVSAPFLLLFIVIAAVIRALEQRPITIATFASRWAQATVSAAVVLAVGMLGGFALALLLRPQ